VGIASPAAEGGKLGVPTKICMTAVQHEEEQHVV
jgi:hypothetical protein